MEDKLYKTWFNKVAELTNRTPEKVEEEAGDAPSDAYTNPCTPEQYAKEFLENDRLYKLENGIALD